MQVCDLSSPSKDYILGGDGWGDGDEQETADSPGSDCKMSESLWDNLFPNSHKKDTKESKQPEDRSVQGSWSMHRNIMESDQLRGRVSSLHGGVASVQNHCRK